jgi:hypothetical protein
MTLGDTAQVWVQKATGAVVEITDYVRYRRTDLVAYAGRSTELDQIGPGRLELGLDNSSGDLTPGRSGAAIQLTLGMPIWVTETLGYKTFEIFSGFLELPDTVENLEGVDNLITVTAVDRKQLLDNGRTLISTLAEYIRYEGRNDLIGYWPMHETVAQHEDYSGGTLGPLTYQPIVTSSTDINAALASLSPGTGAPLPGDDAPRTVNHPQIVVVGGQQIAVFGKYVNVTLADTITVSSGEWLTVAVWTEVDESMGSAYPTLMQLSGGGSGHFLEITRFNTTGAWRAKVKNAGLTWDITATPGAGSPGAGTNWKLGARQLSTVSVNPGVPALTGWADGIAYTGVVTGSVPSPLVFDGLVLGFDLYGMVSHVQIYKSTSPWTTARQQAQIAMANDGLAYQRTDERIATILNYASPRAPIPAVLDEGVTFMQRAGLAGRKPGALIDDAVDTERGRFFVDGGGVSRFHSRVRTHYNL